MRASPLTSWMSTSKLGTVTIASGRGELGPELGFAAGDDREVRERLADRPQHAAVACGVGERRDLERVQRLGERLRLGAQHARPPRAASGSRRYPGSVLLSTSAPRLNLRAISSSQKNSASRSGAPSSVVTTANVVRRSWSSRSTASARSTNPSYIDWKFRKNSAMSWRNWLPRMRSAILVEGPARDSSDTRARACRRPGTAS